MRYGEVFANIAAILLLALMVWSIFFLAGEPLWPQRYARMAFFPNVDAMTTALMRRTCNPAPCLPETFDPNMVASRPQHQPLRNITASVNVTMQGPP